LNKAKHIEQPVVQRSSIRRYPSADLDVEDDKYTTTIKQLLGSRARSEAAYNDKGARPSASKEA